jgi:hypothetical protein
MALFLLFSIPVFNLLLIFWENRYSYDRSGTITEWKEYLYTFLKGVLIFLPGFIIYSFIKSLFPLNYSLLGIFFYYLIFDYLIYIAVILSLYFLLKFFQKKEKYRIDFLDFAVFASGYFTMVALQNTFLHFNEDNSYYLFFLPIAYLSLIVLVSHLIEKIFESADITKILLICLLSVTPFIMALISYLYMINYSLLAFCLNIVILISSFGVKILFER